ncbi:cysteine synthase family protein [Marinobacter salarius]|uniref:PLP-dependent cysteine synthase family protein n=1 Tax=Marinobacter salarius TaxID=1420917 RepID=UPI001BCD5758|nr:cysteine synthase family protein [Marinobacter salarius]MBS8230272.1 cysteine synthase family protein [Marinobacter salarius]
MNDCTITHSRPGILSCIGHTPLVELSDKIVPKDSARVFVKLELANPTGSMKDRMALAMIEEAEKSGKIKPGDSVVEYTSGSTGTSLAQVCAAKKYPLRIVTSDAFSSEKLNHMSALGADLVLIPSQGGGITKALFSQMIEKTRELSRTPNVYWTDQMNNHDMLVGYQQLGKEIWEQTDGRISAFVHGVGTCGSLRGISTVLKARDKGISVVAVEPEESPVLSGGESGSHSIEGIGAGFLVHHWESGLANEIVSVSTKEATEWARKLAEKESIFAGPSSGANVAAALRIASQLTPDSVVVTLLPDTGFKYLSTSLYDLV